MKVTRNAEQHGGWTPEELAHEEHSARTRAKHDREKTSEERLEETLRLSRFVSELAQGASGDVRAR